MKNHDVPKDSRAPVGHLLSVDEVAALLGVSRKTVYRLTKRAELVPSRVGERLRFRPNEINDYLDGIVSEQRREKRRSGPPRQLRPPRSRTFAATMAPAA